MARKKAAAASDPDPSAPVVTDADAGTDPFLVEQLAQIRRMAEAAPAAHTTAMGELALIGLYLPHASLRYLFCNTAFVLSRMTELVGRSFSCKSAFLYEVYRWHLAAGGLYKHILAEPRDSADLRRSITGRLTPRNDLVLPASYVDDWQRACMATLHTYHNYWPTAEGHLSAADRLVVDGVDSLTSVTTKKAAKDIWERGTAEPGFSPIARAITDWSRVYFVRMQPFPVSFVGVNHLKDKPNSQGLPMKTTPGGEQLKFAATTILQFTLKRNLEKVGFSGRTIEIDTIKNSLSTAGDPRSLTVDMTWVTDEATGVQTTWWDWDKATVDLILSFEEKGRTRKRINEVVRVEDLNKTNNTANCPTLRMKKAPLSEIGRAIESRPDIVRGLDDIFGVRRRHVWRPGVPYNTQVAEAAATPLYSSTEEVPEVKPVTIPEEAEE